MATFQTYDPDDESQRAAAKRFNIMVVGESGLGKTTCIQTLLNSLQKEKVDLKWKSKKTVKITEVGSRFIDEKGLLPSYCHIFDSPGYGDDIDNQKSFDVIRDCLIERHKEYDEIRTQSRELDPTALMAKDCRIHCCLYFISPHRMKEIDIKFIKHLREYVVVVPVIAKADTMTSDERDGCLDEVVQAIFALERDLADSMSSRNIPKEERIRATFNFDDQNEFYSSTSHISALSLDSALMQERMNNRKPCKESTEDEPPPPPLDLSKFRTYIGGDPLTEEDEKEKRKVSNEKLEPAEERQCFSKAEENQVDHAHHGGATPSTVDQGGVSSFIDDAFKMPVYDKDGKLVKALKRYHNVFAVVADPSLLRHYEWGSCGVENPLHSDFPVLRRLLFQPKTINGMVNETRKRTNMLLDRIKADEGARRQAAADLEAATEKARVEEEAAQRHLAFKSTLKYWLPLVLCSLVAIIPVVLFPVHSQIALDLMRDSYAQEALPVCLSHDVFEGLKLSEVHATERLEKIEQLEKNIRALQAEKETCQMASVASEKDFDMEKNKYMEQLKKCESDLKLNEAKVSKNKKKIEALTTERDECQSTSTASEKGFHTEKNKCTGQLEKCESDLKGNKAKVSKCEEKMEKLETERDKCQSSSAESEKRYKTEKNKCTGRLEDCTSDLNLNSAQIVKHEKKIGVLESSNRKLQRDLKMSEEQLKAKCFHVESIINYKGIEYTYQELKDGKEPECIVPHSPFSKGVVISTTCNKSVRVTDTHLMATSKGFQLAYSLKAGDVLFGDYDKQQCVVKSVEKELTTQQYFGLNCVHSEVLASGLRASTFGDFHTLPSWYMTYVGGLVGTKTASIFGEYIAEWYF